MLTLLLHDVSVVFHIRYPPICLLKSITNHIAT